MHPPNKPPSIDSQPPNTSDTTGPREWHERDFESWFELEGKLGDEQFLIVSKHTAGKKEIDLVALDKEGRVCLIEVKNEKTGRYVIGQALTYLAMLERIDLRSLESLWRRKHITQELGDAFERCFGIPLQFDVPRFRVILVAPAFELDTLAACRFLAGSTSHREHPTTFEPYCTNNIPGLSLSFDVYADKRLQSFVWLSELKPGACAELDDGNLVVVLNADSRLVYWVVGQLRSNGTVVKLAQASHRRPLETVDVPAMPVTPPSNLDLTRFGEYRKYGLKAKGTARILGVVDKQAIWVRHSEYKTVQFRLEVRSVTQLERLSPGARVEFGWAQAVSLRREDE